MLDPGLGAFDHVVAMDSLIHYAAADIVAALEKLAARTGVSMVFTFAPRTALLTAMHGAGKLFPRGDRSPAIEPVGESDLTRRIAMSRGLADWRVMGTQRVSRGFYISQGMEIARR